MGNTSSRQIAIAAGVGVALLSTAVVTHVCLGGGKKSAKKGATKNSSSQAAPEKPPMEAQEFVEFLQKVTRLLGTEEIDDAFEHIDDKTEEEKRVWIHEQVGSLLYCEMHDTPEEEVEGKEAEFAKKMEKILEQEKAKHEDNPEVKQAIKALDRATEKMSVKGLWPNRAEVFAKKKQRDSELRDFEADMKKMLETFNAMDTNQDGIVSEEEFDAYIKENKDVPSDMATDYEGSKQAYDDFRKALAAKESAKDHLEYDISLSLEQLKLIRTYDGVQRHRAQMYQARVMDSMVKLLEEGKDADFEAKKTKFKEEAEKWQEENPDADLSGMDFEQRKPILALTVAIQARQTTRSRYASKIKAELETFLESHNKDTPEGKKAINEKEVELLEANKNFQIELSKMDELRKKSILEAEGTAPLTELKAAIEWQMWKTLNASPVERYLQKRMQEVRAIVSSGDPAAMQKLMEETKPGVTTQKHLSTLSDAQREAYMKDEKNFESMKPVWTMEMLQQFFVESS